MKYNIINLFLLLGLVFASCTDMNDVSKAFLTPESRYSGSPDTIKILSGNQRLFLNFRLTDASVNKMKIYWNNKSDSIVMDVNMDVSPKTFNVEVDNLAEGAYSFEVYTFDGKGNNSIVSRATGKVYGSAYAASLLDTPIKAYLASGETTKVEAKWGSPDLSALGMELYYTNTAGEEVFVYSQVPKLETEIFEKETILENYKSGTKLRYRTLYLPEENAVDTFFTSFREVDVKGAAIEYERLFWIISGKYDTGNSSNGENGNGPRTPQLLLDGNVDTHWHADKSVGKYPHVLTVDMGEVVTISGFYIQHRPSLVTPAKTIAFRTSVDGIKWISVGEYITDKSIKEKQYFDLTIDTDCRYFELIVKSDYGNGTSTGLAEMGAYKR